MSRTRRSAANLAASGLSSIVGVGIGFVATPLVLRWLGAERLGLFRTATDWAAYLTLFEMGLSGALAPLLVQAKAAGDRERLLATLAAGMRAYARIAITIIIGGLVLLLALPALTGVSGGLGAELQAGFALALAANLALPLTVYRPLADALQKGYLISLLLTVQGVLIAVGCVLAAHAGWGLVGQFGVTAVGTLILPLGLTLLLQPVASPSELLKSTRDVTEPARKLRGLNRETFVFQLVGRICLFTDTIIIGLFLGPLAVAAFFLTTRLPTAASTQVQAIGGATWASLAELYQSGQHELFRQRLRELTKFTAIIAGAVIVPLAVLTGPFVTLWVGSDQYAGDAVAALAVLNAVLLPIFSLWGWVFMGTGRVRRLLPLMIGQGLLNLGASLLATWQIGLAGPVIGTAVVNLAYNWWMIVGLLRADFGLTPFDLLIPLCIALVPAVLITTCLLVLRETWPTYSWLRLGGEFALAVVGDLFIAWRLVFSKSDRVLLYRFFGRLRS